MRKLRLFASLIAVFAAMLLATNTANADNITDSTKGIFKLQKIRAEKGDAHSQYRLGSMYEFGIGVKKNLPKANEWYAKSFKNGYAQSKDRLLYLEIRKNGFNNNIHTDWLNKIKKDASAGDQHAALLLGQIYSYGIGVKKDLNKSLEFFKKSSVFSDPAVIYEIERVEKEKNQLDRQETKRTKKNEVKKPSKPGPKVAAQPGPEVAANNKADDRAEKRRRYEEVMRKMKEEQRIIDEQQNWAEGAESSP
jgi:hypothetical protein